MKVCGSKFIFLATNDFGVLHETKKFLFKNLEMKDTREATHVIEVEIFRDRLQGV